MSEIEHGNQFSTRLKDNNSMLIRRNLLTYNPKPLLYNIYYCAKNEENLSRNAQDRERKQIEREETEGHSTQIFE